jgi:hypothetical protein
MECGVVLKDKLACGGIDLLESAVVVGTQEIEAEKLD